MNIQCYTFEREMNMKKIALAGPSITQKEIDYASFIELSREYKAKDLLNIIRARTFAPFPAAYFYYNNEKYEVRVQINKVTGKLENNINYDEISMEGLKINE